MRSLVGEFGRLFGLGVVALVARYGYISSDNKVNGAILAFPFAGLAAGGLFGHAVAVAVRGQTGLQFWVKLMPRCIRAAMDGSFVGAGSPGSAAAKGTVETVRPAASLMSTFL